MTELRIPLPATLQTIQDGEDAAEFAADMDYLAALLDALEFGLRYAGGTIGDIDRAWIERLCVEVADIGRAA